MLRRHQELPLIALLWLAGCPWVSKGELADVVDGDGDSVAGPAVGGPDCDDADPAVGAPAPRYVDGDGDGAGGLTTEEACPGAPGLSDRPDDCDDGDADLNPFDEDGDGVSTCAGDCDDRDRTVGAPGRRFADADGDGYGDDAAAVVVCAGDPRYVASGGDCDDDDAALNLADVDGDGRSSCAEDCDDLDAAVADLTLVWPDLDRDGAGDPGGLTELVCAIPAYQVANASDCDDLDPERRPGRLDDCRAGVDLDCDGYLPEPGPGVEGTTTWYRDDDQDGYGGALLQYTCDGAPPDHGGVQRPGDCDDRDPAAGPWLVHYADADGDGAGDVTAPAPGGDCEPAPGFVGRAFDCDDSDAGVGPGAPEDCGSGVDEDCDGRVDGGDPDCCPWTWPDVDGDGAGAMAAAPRRACDGTGALEPTDCDDGDPTTTAPEVLVVTGGDLGTTSACTVYRVSGDLVLTERATPSPLAAILATPGSSLRFDSGEIVATRLTVVGLTVEGTSKHGEYFVVPAGGALEVVGTSFLGDPATGDGVAVATLNDPSSVGLYEVSVRAPGSRAAIDVPPTTQGYARAAWLEEVTLTRPFGLDPAVRAEEITVVRSDLWGALVALDDPTGVPGSVTVVESVLTNGPEPLQTVDLTLERSVVRTGASVQRSGQSIVVDATIVELQPPRSPVPGALHTDVYGVPDDRPFSAPVASYVLAATALDPRWWDLHPAPGSAGVGAYVDVDCGSVAAPGACFAADGDPIDAACGGPAASGWARRTTGTDLNWDADSDGDGVLDCDEYRRSDPMHPDTDRDGVLDGVDCGPADAFDQGLVGLAC